MQGILDAAGWPRDLEPQFAPREFLEQDLVAWANLEMLQQIRRERDLPVHADHN